MSDIDALPHIDLFDGASSRNMRYVYPTANHWTAGWILYKHADGQWVTLRKASQEDIESLNSAVSAAHHAAQKAGGQ